jgi:hypothetical protein
MRRTEKQHWFGTPTHLVLYRTPDRWRFAAYFKGPIGILDGDLEGTSVSSQSVIAQAALHHKVEGLIRRQLIVCWEPGDQLDWWSGTVVKAGPTDAASSRSGRHSDESLLVRLPGRRYD